MFLVRVESRRAIFYFEAGAIEKNTEPSYKQVSDNRLLLIIGSLIIT